MGKDKKPSEEYFKKIDISINNIIIWNFEEIEFSHENDNTGLSKELISFLIYTWKIKNKKQNLRNIIFFIYNYLYDINSIHGLLKIISLSIKNDFKWKFDLASTNEIAKGLNYAIKNKIILNKKQNITFWKNLQNFIFTIINQLNDLNETDKKTKWIKYHLKQSFKQLVKSIV